jgi:hypothetical protein
MRGSFVATLLEDDGEELATARATATARTRARTRIRARTTATATARGRTNEMTMAGVKTKCIVG